MGRLFMEVDKWDDETLVLRDPDDRRPIWGTVCRKGLTACAPAGSGPFSTIIDRSGEITSGADFGCAKACATYDECTVATENLKCLSSLSPTP